MTLPENASQQAGAESAALEHILGMTVDPINAVGEFHNRHFCAGTRAGTRVFVKVFDDRQYWNRARTAAAAAQSLLRTPRMLDYGELDSTRWWITYEWLDLEPFTPSRALLRELGSMLGRLHGSSTVLSDFAVHDIDREISLRADLLDNADPHAARRVRALHQRWGPTSLPGEVVLIHGDFHWRNVGLLGGRPVLCDLENMSAAPALVEFGKLVDLGGLADLAHRSAFFGGYEQHAPPIWPWPTEMRAVSLWTTCGVLVYSLARRLDSFARHGYRRLAELEGGRSRDER